MPNDHKNNLNYFLALRSVAILSAIVLVVTLTVYVGKLASQVGEADPSEQSISVDGSATVKADPDKATVSVSIETKNVDTAKAQDLHSTQSKALTEAIMKLGIEKKDIQTSYYNIFEDTRWNPDNQRYDSVGWVVSESWDIEIRDLTLVDQVLQVAGHSGATDVNGPNFVVDDTTVATQKARTEAIADSRAKATEIATALGLKLDEIVGYSEWADNVQTPFYAYAERAMDMKDPAPLPQVMQGQEDVSINVTITFRLR
ncbi:hypothetical protein COV92_01460 [Candidatus Uhrbacteria bacterium CG11_big_fil_rev_8_21_14_0_20_41_9]|nr:MAG: hypothetical protein COV92_01460 [Candidatus Uhrbacteria bacterium CG11_big_fil_rev_8_21_14_0_20_41_9]